MNTLTKPRRLTPGATIGIAAISGPVEEEKLEKGILALRDRGFSVLEASNLRKREGFLAGSDEERAAGYRQLLRDPAVAAIVFARGGYGSSRVLSRLDPEEIRAHPKIHLGSSDVTALFAFLQRQGGLVTFFGPMAAVEIAARRDLDWERVLFGAIPDSHLFEEEDVLAAGRGQGVLVGGCLSLLASLAGTPEAVRCEDAVLFWEDVAEPIYRIDRLLTQLERSGTFDRLQGMVIGSVAPAQGCQTPPETRAFLQERFRGAPFPVAAGFPAGHGPDPRTLPLGVRVSLDLEGGRRLVFLEAGVR